ncbi:hypothetical protein [Nonomuraea sp. NPDC049480]|uniref:hypothetical protein n=1 Tax=Nonomuraea sp. NPDC049480 TaxID=3364353 RepID=UPI003789516E
MGRGGRAHRVVSRSPRSPLLAGLLGTAVAAAAVTAGAWPVHQRGRHVPGPDPGCPLPEGTNVTVAIDPARAYTLVKS